MSDVDLRVMRSRPEYLIDLTMFGLERLYNALISEDSPKFKDAVVPLFFHEKSSNGDECQAEMEKLVLENKEAPGKLGAIAPIIVSCAYCGDALRALNSGERDLAWSLIAVAQYWYGSARINEQVPEFRRQTEMNARQSTARKAGMARGDKFEPIRLEAWRLVVERCPAGGWPSFRNAAQRIEMDILKFSEKNRLSISGDRLTATVSGWLKKMPDADRYFKARKNKVDDVG